MYRITYVHKNETEENPLYIPGDQDYCLTDGKLQLKCGKSGELDVSVPDINPAKQDIVCLTDEVIFYRDDKELWRGRPITVQLDFNNTGKLICEGILSYLYDTYYEPFEFEGSPKDFFRMVLENHNKYVDERKQFQVGEITVEDPNDYINRSSIYYDRTLNVLTEKLINDSLGGYFRARVDEDDTRYLDYLENYTGQASQRVEYGSNILDIAQEIEYSDLATVILPLGARLEDEDGMETDEYTTIASVNGGSIYYEDPEAVKEYGWICVSNEWEDVTIPSNLLDRAKTYLEQVTNAVASFTVNAVDLSLISEDEKPINLGDYVYIRSVAHGINQYVQLTEMTIYPLAPENDELVFGSDTSGITDLQRNSDRDVQTALGSLSMRVTNLTADVINAVYANIQNIIADTITTDYLEAIIAKMGYVTIDYLEDYYASIEYLEANYASITSLEVAFEDVELINADVANIKNVLAGNAGTGDLQTIVLTADNAYIEDAVIINALMNTVLASVLTAGVIYTDYIKIANNENQSLWIDGSTMQFTDENGVVRVQIGLDASGNYSYYLWDENGVLIWDAMGLTEAGLTGNGAIIKDAAVADDANISASKLNIEELTSILNENAELILSAEQITIGGGTLDYVLTEITQQIEDLEALEGVDSVENYYILGGPDEPPWEPGEDGSASILGEMILGEAILGTGHWTTEQPKASEGEYVWFSQKITYVNGDVMWTTPTLLTDYYVRNAITIQQTELEVVQGQIQAKIWQTDIDEAISDQYAIITMLIDAIDLRVGTLETTADTLASQVADISISLDTITAEVREVYEWTSDALIDGVPYYAVSDSPDYYPPFEWEDDQTAVLGEAILGQMVLGVNGESTWTTEQPAYKEGQYIWLAYLRTRADGSTYWTEPTLLTDENVTVLSEQYSTLTMTVNGITAEVANVWAELGANYSTTTEVKAIIDASVSEESSSILQEVSYNYATKTELSEYPTTSAMTAYISQYVDDSMGQIAISVSSFGDKYIFEDYNSEKYSDWEIRRWDSGTGTFSQVTDLSWGRCYKLQLTSSDGRYGIRYKLGDYLPAGNYRLCFSVWTEPGYEDTAQISFGVGIVDSVQFIITTAGYIPSDGTRLDYSYTFTVEEDQVGEAYIYFRTGTGQEPVYFNDIYVISESASDLGATAGIVLSVGGQEISYGKLDLSEVRRAFANDDASITIGAGTVTFLANTLLIDSDQFTLDADGNATFSGNLSAPTGSIGGWTIGTHSLYNGTSGMTSTINGAYIGTNGIRQYNDGEYLNITSTKITNGDSDDNRVRLSEAKMCLYHEGTELGFFGTNFWDDLPDLHGLVINLENTTDYIAFGHKDSATATIYNSSYYISYNSAISAYRHNFYGSIKLIDNRLYFSGDTYLNQLTGGGVYCSDGFSAVGAILAGNTTYGSSYMLHVKGSAYASGSWYEGSDESIKTDIAPLNANTETFMDKIEPISFRYKNGENEKLHFGVTSENIAQALEAENIDPNDTAILSTAVDEDGDEYGAVAYDELIGILLYEVKKLKSEIQEMKGE